MSKSAQPLQKNLPEINSGFTLIEVMLIVTLMTIVSAMFFVAFNPKENLEKSDAIRDEANIALIKGAVTQYTSQNNWELPQTILLGSDPSGDFEICRTTSSDCTGYTDLGMLTVEGKYLQEIPVHSAYSNVTTVGTGYCITKNSSDEITIYSCAE